MPRRRRWILAGLAAAAGLLSLYAVFPEDPAARLLQQADAAMQQLRPDEAERLYRQAVDENPEFDLARRRLASLLSLKGRTCESLEHRRLLVQRGSWEVEDLLLLAKPEDLFAAPELDFLLRRDPDNASLLTAKARRSLLGGELDHAARWIERALAADPQLVDAHAAAGMLLLERDPAVESLLDWNARLPADAARNAEVWLVRGMLARKLDDARGAARCFAEALSRFPQHRQSMHQLSLALAAAGDDEPARKLAARVEKLDLLSRVVNDIYDRPEWGQPWFKGAELLESLGRTPEAAAWYRAIERRGLEGRAAAAKRADVLAQKLAEDKLPARATAESLWQLDRRKYPLPRLEVAAAAAPERASTSHMLRFADAAAAAGVDFALVGHDLPLLRPREFAQLLGSGAGVLDFDADGWPDLYCAQGSAAADASPGPRLPGAASGAAAGDRLFRNRGDGRFVDVTVACGLGDERLSHAVAVGDYNNDGFADILVGNAGANRLYENNGDGTFRDVSRRAGIAGNSWTTSCALADLNGDGLPDIYEVNYLGPEPSRRRVCLARADACTPVDFPGDPDRLLMNLGDGSFRDQTADAGISAPDGRGLGVVVGDFEGRGVVSVFVANDVSANHLYVNQAGRGEPPRFVERGKLTGLAFDADGYSQACMGVAVDDATGDGLLDMLVTNFHDESNTLYVGQGRGLFQDETRLARLRTASLPALGFGAEFLDADLDGDADLVIANGHVENQTAAGVPFQMRPQLFENRGGQFWERGGADAGSYFERPVVGRCLIRLDYDRDGREDFAVTHLDAPLALLRNETPTAGNFLAVSLRGVACGRDAVGAAVTVLSGDGRQRTRQLTAGDGFQCSNQRMLVFGLGPAAEVDTLTVRWPTGDQQQHHGLAVNRQLLLIQGGGSPVDISP